MAYCSITLQEDSFHWILNFAISLIQNCLNSNPTNYLNNVDIPIIAYTREFIKP